MARLLSASMPVMMHAFPASLFETVNFPRVVAIRDQPWCSLLAMPADLATLVAGALKLYARAPG